MIERVRSGSRGATRSEGAKLTPVLQALKDAIKQAAHLQQQYRRADGLLEGGFKALQLEKQRFAETEQVVSAAKQAYLDLVAQAAEEGKQVALQDNFVDKEVSVVQSTKNMVDQATRVVAQYVAERRLIGEQLDTAQDNVYKALDAVIQEVGGKDVMTLLEWIMNLLPNDGYGPNGTQAGTSLPRLSPPATSLPGASEDESRLGVPG
jgi:hypothetical protein